MVVHLDCAASLRHLIRSDSYVKAFCAWSHVVALTQHHASPQPPSPRADLHPAVCFAPWEGMGNHGESGISCRTISDDMKEYSIAACDGFFTRLDRVLFSGSLLCGLLFFLFRIRVFLWWSTGFFAFASFRLLLRLSTVKEESILIVRELLVQVRTRYWSGQETTEVLDAHQIEDVIINEGITMHQVIYYLAFVIKGNSKLVLAFSHVFPRLAILHPVYLGVRSILFGEPAA
ncbi:putative phosphatidylinositol glycan; class H [Paratrimastix pyriformis]|uniref:Phosphatidylinositol glycan n=1 Tax=Paratrimastix pyriformis TaxID=342808 RepID=A0ABQ8U6F7_9EUKA|nr:putative phosphatidylinositol glycan; class H [Paratrimastix pyriformis]